MNNPSTTFELVRFYPEYSTDPITGKVGETYYNTTSNSLRLCVQSSPSVVWSSVGGGANQQLSNLSATAVNADINPGIADSINLGSLSLPYASISAYTVQSVSAITAASGVGAIFSSVPTTGSVNSDFLSMTTGTVVNGVSGNITIATGMASGTGSQGNILIDAASAQLRSGTPLQFWNASSSNYVSFVASASLSANTSWTLPLMDGTSGQVIQTNGLGQLSFVTASSGSPSSGALGSVQLSNGSGGFSSDPANFWWDSTAHRLGIGTNTPANQLQIVGGAQVMSLTNPNSASNAIYMAVADGSHFTHVFGAENSSGGGLIGAGFPYGLIFGSFSAQAMLLVTAATPRVTISATGNVGIGVTPSYFLHAQANVTGGGTPLAYFHSTATSGECDVVSISSGFNTILRVTNDSLGLSSGLILGNTGGETADFQINNQANGHLGFGTNGHFGVGFGLIALTPSGTIQFVDGSQGTVGNVWTSTDANGTGTWLAPAAAVGTTPQVQYITLSSGNISSQSAPLTFAPHVPANTLVDVIMGDSQVYGVDYAVSGSTLTWSGYALAGSLSTGDVLRVVYWT
jgi:hypothetical protein